MKNAGITIGMVAIGLGLASIGFNLNGNTATATPGVFNTGPEEPTIVWYGVASAQGSGTVGKGQKLYRAWSDGSVEVRHIDAGNAWDECSDTKPCVGSWFVISSPNEGLNAAADINFDSQVNAEDLGIMLAAWGDAPRNDYPPSDCPLGLIP